MTGVELLEVLEAFRDLRITIIGDYILDRYIIGDTDRVSREAPVIVINYRETVHQPGGAANAAQNVTALGASARALGALGEDPEGEVLLALLQEREVDVSGIVRSGDIDTASKMRIAAGELHAQRQQVARVDHSYRLTPDSPLVAALSEGLPDVIRGSHAVLISDYGMGVVPGPLSRAAIEGCRSAGVPIVVDSRYNLLDYRGAQAATPNETEMLDALDLRNRDVAPMEELAQRFLKQAGLEGAIITRGSVGMFVCEAGKPGSAIGIIGSNEATDVTGAGDTVSAVTALSLGAGASLRRAAEIATYAASVVVMKRGTATVTPAELELRFTQYPPSERALWR